MEKELDGKTTIVTGGGSGIGRAASLVLAREGSKVVVADIDKESGKKTVDLIEEKGGEAKFVKTDVTNEDSIENLMEKTIEVYDSLDCAFNNAGVGPEVKLMNDYSLEYWNQTILINLKSIWLCMKNEVREMMKQEQGSIVNAGSLAGLMPPPGQSIYNAAKAGVVALTKSGAMEYSSYGIRINAVCPGAIQTSMLDNYPDDVVEMLSKKNEMNRLGEPEEIAEAVTWLLSDRASYVTGQSLIVDGGTSAGISPG